MAPDWSFSNLKTKRHSLSGTTHLSTRMLCRYDWQQLTLVEHWLRDWVKKSTMLVYDGDCVFCCRCARWVAKRSDIDLLADGEADLEALGLTVADTKRFVWWVDGDVKLSGHLAIGKVLRSLGGGWMLLGAAMKVPPVSLLAALIYRLVAANRHRFGGGCS